MGLCHPHKVSLGPPPSLKWLLLIWMESGREPAAEVSHRFLGSVLHSAYPQ